MRQHLIHAVARVTLALTWIYQGLVPKLLCAGTSGEIDTIRAIGLFGGHERAALHAAGALEIAFGLALLVFWRWRALLAINGVVLLALFVGVLVWDPRLFGRQFDPVPLSLAMAALGLVAALAARQD